MSSDEFPLPEYLVKLSVQDLTAKEDNFGPEDQLWTGENGELDPIELLEIEGREKNSPIEILIAALILGHSPDANEEEVQKRLSRALGQIRGESRSGRPPKDDDEALLKIASKFHKERFFAKGGQVALRPIVQAVVEQHFAHVPGFWIR